MAKSKIYGLSIYGDGATIVKVPLFNALACSPDNPNCVLDVIDCSDHCANREKKDTFYLSQQMLPKMKEVDPQKTLFHLITFDGASNVQKAGRLTNQHFPRCTVILSKEHVDSLVFGKIFSLQPMKEMCTFFKKVRIFSHVSFDIFVTDICYLVAALRLETFLDQTCRAYTDGSRCD